ncbi:MAG TPA: Fis family transcriptional regulator, partial [Anaeromyxobacteraceae bacterium]
ELRLAEGRAALERLVRRLGARRPALVRALAEGWRRPDGSPPGAADLEALLDHHGLARAFDRRERALALHALRAAGGVRARAAAALGLPADGLEPALRRLGAVAEAESIREDRRREVRRRATLAERARLLAADEELLAELGLLEEVAADLRARLPDHLRALRAGRPSSLAAALGRSLSLSRPAVDALALKLGLDLGPAQAPAARPRPPGDRVLRPAARRDRPGRSAGPPGPNRPRGTGRPGRR